MKRNWIVLLIYLLLGSILTQPLQAATPRIASPSAYLLDYNTGQVLYALNEDEPHAPASITKVMVLYLIFDALKAGEVTLEEYCQVSERALTTEEGGSIMWLNSGEWVVFEEIIKGIAIASGNDATIVAAETVSGSVESFIESMNAKAAELGLSRTHFVNTHGLDEAGHTSTARDIAMMGYYLLRDHPESLHYTAMQEMTYSNVLLTSRNLLLDTYPGVDGIKTGFTDDAGNCLLATAERDGVRLISVVLGSGSEAMRNAETTALLDYGFGGDFERTVYLKKGDLLQEKLNVRRAGQDQIELEVAEDMHVVLPTGNVDELEQKLTIPEQMDAPVHKGDVVGSLTLSHQDKELRSVAVLAAEDSGEAGFFKAMWQSIVEFFMGLFRIV